MRHGGRLPSSLPIASLPLLHAGKLGHDGGDHGRSGGGRARSGLPTAPAVRRGAAAAGRPRCGAAERSGRGWPTAVRRGGEERPRWAKRDDGWSTRWPSATAGGARGRPSGGEAGRRGARMSGRPERRGRCGGDGGSPFPCSSGVDVGHAELVLTRPAAPCARCASAADADAMAAALRRARSSRARMRTAGRPSSGIRAWEEAGRNCRRRAPPPSPATASSLVELRRPRPSSSLVLWLGGDDELVVVGAVRVGRPDPRHVDDSAPSVPTLQVADGRRLCNLEHHLQKPAADDFCAKTNSKRLTAWDTERVQSPLRTA